MKWNELLRLLGPAGKDFPFYRIRGRKEEKFFHARATDQIIIVEAAKKQIPSANITEPRVISFKQFKCVAERYNDYVRGVKGVRPEIRDKCGLVSSYIISLIASLF